MADYFKRKSGEGSTSRFIQMNVPDKNGNRTEKVCSMQDTPDQGIQNKLKNATNVTVEFTKVKILGVNLLIPKLVKKQINETKPTPDKAKYGDIQVTETKGGHTIVVDNTEGNKRLITQHPTGSYTAMVDNGDCIQKAVNDHYTIIEKDWKVNVMGDEVEVIQGDNRVNIKKGQFNNIGGDQVTNIDGNKDEKVKGDSSHDVDGSGGIHYSGDGGLKVDGNMKETVGGNLDVTVTGNITIISTGNTNIVAAGMCSITAAQISLN